LWNKLRLNAELRWLVAVADVRTLEDLADTENWFDGKAKSNRRIVKQRVGLGSGPQESVILLCCFPPPAPAARTSIPLTRRGDQRGAHVASPRSMPSAVLRGELGRLGFGRSFLSSAFFVPAWRVAFIAASNIPNFNAAITVPVKESHLAVAGAPIRTRRCFVGTGGIMSWIIARGDRKPSHGT
jgi:hypothetical protein